MAAQRSKNPMFVVAIAGALVGLPLMFLLLLAPGSTPSCQGDTQTPPGPANAAGVPTNYLPFFDGAAQHFNLGPHGWAILAAINYRESTFGTSTLPGVHSGSNFAGAAGPMQIGIGGGPAGDGWDSLKGQIPPNLPGGAQPPSVYNEADAVYAAAALLKSDGAPGDWSGAIYHYNHAQWYVDEVETRARTYEAATGKGPAGAAPGGQAVDVASAPPLAAGCSLTAAGTPVTNGSRAKILANGLAAAPAAAPPQVKAMIAAGNQLIHYPYSWGGGHCTGAMRIPPGANACPGQEENGGPGYDCSGATSFVLWNAGFGQSVLGASPEVSSAMMSEGEPGAGPWVTWYSSPGHVFIVIAGIALNTSHGYDPAVTPGGSGPRWMSAPLAVSYETQRGSDAGQYVARHPQGL